MKRIYFALFAVYFLYSCKTNQYANIEKQFEISQLSFDIENSLEENVEIQQIASVEKSVELKKPKSLNIKSINSEQVTNFQSPQKSNFKAQKIKFVDEEPKSTTLKKKKKIEVFSIISVILALSSLAIYIIEGAFLVYPIIAFALIAAILSIVRFKQNKGKYFGLGIAVAGIIISLLALTISFIFPDALDVQSMLGWIIID